jgi:hypothetical protein
LIKDIDYNKEARSGLLTKNKILNFIKNFKFFILKSKLKSSADKSIESFSYIYRCTKDELNNKIPQFLKNNFTEWIRELRRQLAKKESEDARSAISSSQQTGGRKRKIIKKVTTK